MSVMLLLLSCLVGALVPGFGSEVALLASLALADGPMRVAVIVFAAAAQTLGKIVVYAAAAVGARSAAAASLGSQWLHRAFQRSPGHANAIVFASALTSVPPLYGTTIVCGIARHGSIRFGVAVFLARIIRYSILAAVTDPVRAWVLQ